MLPLDSALSWIKNEFVLCGADGLGVLAESSESGASCPTNSEADSWLLMNCATMSSTFASESRYHNFHQDFTLFTPARWLFSKTANSSALYSNALGVIVPLSPWSPEACSAPGVTIDSTSNRSDYYNGGMRRVPQRCYEQCDLHIYI